MVVTKKPKRPTISFYNDSDKKVEEAGNADNADDVGRFPLADKCVPHLPPPPLQRDIVGEAITIAGR